jgi:3D (Asp-Asp-Asp) domain-containing protein
MRMSHIVRLILSSLFVFVWGLQLSIAQLSNPALESAKASEKPQSAYRLDFSVNEMENGKKINTRQYSMNLNAGDSNSIKIGTRVPVETKQGEFTYLDVGTNIWSRIRELENGLGLEVRAEISNFAMNNQENNLRPLLRQMQINGSTLATVGKPLVIGSVDDPNSKRQFQLEVTATKLK